MKKCEKISRRALSLVLTLALALMTFAGTAVTASAADAASLDFSETGKITLTLADTEGNTVTGGVITLYEVASLYLDDGNMAYAYTDAFAGCTAVLDVTDTSLAKTLAEYAESTGISGTDAVPGADGTITYAGLELGLYLIVQTSASDGYETINPFVVTVPMDNDGVWEYEVNATPKVGTVTPEETTSETETPTETTSETDTETTEETEVTETPTETETETETTEPEGTTTTEETTTLTKLPQTGQLNWPVPLLAVAGLLLFAFGWSLVFAGRKEKDA